MNLLASKPVAIEPGWKTYLRAIAFSLPALFILLFSTVFLLPKLETLWRDTHFTDSFSMAASAITSVHVAQFLTQNFLIILATIITAIALLEWRSTQWPRYRKATVGVATFFTNTAVLVFITMMFMTALLAAPALLGMK